MDQLTEIEGRAPRHLFVAGFSHARVPIRLREKYTLSPASQRQLLAEARSCAPVTELVVLNTCNRFELYVVSLRSTWTPAAQVGHILRMTWPDMSREDFDELVQAAYWHEDDACLRHLFRTAASLDSMVVGEPEINGQVKAAYHLARDIGATGPVLNRLFQNAFSAAKRVRTETEIARGFVSVGTVAVRAGLAALCGPARRVLVLGAGQMACTIARQLRKLHGGDIVIANRTPGRAHALAQEVGGTAIPLCELPSALASADLVLAAAGSPEFLITAALLEAARPAAGPLTLVDVCLPRSVDPAARACAGIRLMDLDDLQVLVADGESKRRAGSSRAEELVQECVAEYGPRLLFAMGRGELPPLRCRGSAAVAR